MSFVVAVILRYFWNILSLLFIEKGMETLKDRRRQLSMELILGLSVLFLSAAIGAPVAYSIIAGVVYLGVGGQDLAIAGETMVQRHQDLLHPCNDE